MQLTSTKRNLANAILAFGVAVGTFLGSPFGAVQPAEAARDLRIQVERVSGGADIVTGEQFRVRVRVSNPGSGANGANDFARNVRFEMALDGAQLVRSAAVTGNWATGFNCGASTATRLICTGGDLQTGESVTIRVRTSTTVVVGSGSGQLRVIADAGNFIRERNEDNNVRSLTIRHN